MDRQSLTLVDAATVLAAVTALAWAIGALYADGVLTAYGVKNSGFQYDVPTTIHNGFYQSAGHCWLVVFLIVSISLVFVLQYACRTIQPVETKPQQMMKGILVTVLLALYFIPFLHLLNGIVKAAAKNDVDYQKVQFSDGHEQYMTISLDKHSEHETFITGWSVFYGNPLSVIYDAVAKQSVIVATTRITEVRGITTNDPINPQTAP